jgi:hypothetical protein
MGFGGFSRLFTRGGSAFLSFLLFFASQGFYGFWLFYSSMEVPPPKRVSSSAEAGARWYM